MTRGVRAVQGGWLVTATAVACAVLLAAPAAADSDSQAVSSVRDVQVRLTFRGGVVGAETLERLQQALDSVVRAALLDQLGGDLGYIASHQKEVATAVGKAVESPLSSRGFILEELSIEPGTTTVVNATLAVSEQRINQISVRFFILGNSPLVNAAADPDAQQIAATLYATVARTPVGDPGWLERLIQQGVTDELAKLPAYSDFVSEVFVQPGEQTKVVVAFTPRPGAQLVTQQRLELHSITVLNTELTGLRERSGFYLTGLLGAPESFVSAKQTELGSALYQHLIGDCGLMRICPEAELELEAAGCSVTADLSIESSKTLAQASMRLDLRSTQTGGRIYGRLRGRAGIIPQPGWAIYGGADYYPGDDQLHTILGAARLLNSRGYVGAGFDFKSQSLRFEGQHELGPQTYISADYYCNRDYNRLSEVALHWRLQQPYELQLGSSFDGGVFAAVAANF
jgi:hypothetical protein